MRYAPFDPYLFPVPPEIHASPAYVAAQRPDLAHVSADGPPGPTAHPGGST
ncbi:hypothetical protein [Stackebrandtia soli]|uniref:hypothetical protein n=1 Tax=Stackebrandtia soli TaxID=1892856 RepID=UPI0039E75824